MGPPPESTLPAVPCVGVCNQGPPAQAGFPSTLSRGGGGPMQLGVWPGALCRPWTLARGAVNAAQVIKPLLSQRERAGTAAFWRAPLAGLSASVLAFSSLAEPMCPADGAPGWRFWALVEALPVQRGWPTTNGAHGRGLRAGHGHPHHLVLPAPPGCPCPALATGRSLVPTWPLPAQAVCWAASHILPLSLPKASPNSRG